MFKTFLKALLGTLFLALGLLGLLLPFLPGFLFFLLAIACFASLSPALNRRLHRQPRVSRFLRRLEAGEELDPLSRIKLTFWAGLEAIKPHR